MHKFIPGLLDKNYEFFKTDDDVSYVHDGQVKDFSNVPSQIYSLLDKAIDNTPGARSILKAWFPESEYHQTKCFTGCRFGGADFKADIENGQLQQAEYWNCPRSGNCVGEGILCRAPIINGHVISKSEIKLWALSTTNKTNEVIAEELSLPMGTYHKLKKILHEKLGNIQTKQCLTKLAHEWNVI